VRLVTWNVNSLKVRLPRVLEFLELHEPDVVCLQETKCEPGAFPVAELAAAGYGAVHHSGGRWAGVAILARDGLTLENETRGLPGEVVDDEARWVEATVGGVRVCSVYVVNGREVGSEWFDAKLRFLEAMASRAGTLGEAELPVVIAGDMNVAPGDADVYDPAAFAAETHVTPDERSRLQAVLDAGGLVDAYRALHPDRGAGGARVAGAPAALRRLDRHVLARQREVRRVRRGLRLLRPVALRRGRHADARDDGARPDPRARARRPRRRGAPLLHGHPGPGPVQARLREGSSRARLVAEHTNLKRCASIGHMSACAREGS
jgi:exodeoxyribonuclease-3